MMTIARPHGRAEHTAPCASGRATAITFRSASRPRARISNTTKKNARQVAATHGFMPIATPAAALKMRRTFPVATTRNCRPRLRSKRRSLRDAPAVRRPGRRPRCSGTGAMLRRPQVPPRQAHGRRRHWLRSCNTTRRRPQIRPQMATPRQRHRLPTCRCRCFASEANSRSCTRGEKSGISARDQVSRRPATAARRRIDAGLWRRKIRRRQRTAVSLDGSWRTIKLHLAG